MDEVETAPAFVPSAFWRDINEKNIRMLEADGLENFKRTVSQNYYNWLITRVLDPQFRRVVAQWLRRPSRRPFRTEIEDDVTLRLITGSEPVTLTRRQRLFYRLFVGGVWEIMCRADTAGLRERLAEPELGNPIRIRQDDKLITQDLANSIIECNLVVELAKAAGARPRIAEIGAGYGRLAHAFVATQRGSYFIFDIPPALHVAQWYLSRVLADKRIFPFRRFARFEEVREELEQADLAFLSANQILQFPTGYFDVMLSISTLPEMRVDQVALYRELFGKLSRRHIFLKQWKDWKNHLDGTDLGVADYDFGRDWRLTLDRTDPVNPRFFNRVWKRI